MTLFFTVLTGFTYLSGFTPTLAFAISSVVLVVMFMISSAKFNDAGGKKYFLFTIVLLIVYLLMLKFTNILFSTTFDETKMKVTDCGCFGDAIKLKPWETFWKDIVLDISIFILVIGMDYIKPLFKTKTNNAITTVATIASIWFCFSNYAWGLPVIDFRPYKIGNNIRELRQMQKPRVSDWVFIYKNLKTGEQKEFTITRAQVSDPSVRYSVTDGIGTMIISRFDNDTGALARQAAESFVAQNVKGVIVDLRDNGGGSLQEVVEMAGLFIPKGPVVQVKSKRTEGINVMEDKNPDVVWDGPLTILTNHNSASASEILAAAIQDYKRGVIAGTPSFGKGTVQSFIDLDNFLIPQFDTIKPIGSVKITQQKFYRINGGATQLKGVTPDVLLPDPYEFIDIGEKELDNPMPWDEIGKANYSEYTNIKYPSILKNSQKRIKNSSQFALIEQQAAEIKIKKNDTKYNLNFEKFRAEQKEFRDQNKKYEELRKEIKGFSASILDEDKSRMSNDTTKLGRENRWAKNVAKDIYIHEASNIINDLR